MNTKKVIKLMSKTIPQAMMESINYNYPSIPVCEENGRADNRENKTLLDCKLEEADRYDSEKAKQQLRETECRHKELNQYKKELWKERKARKKAVEQQKEMKYLLKSIQDQLKDIEKKQQKLKVYIKKKDREKRKDIDCIKNILAVLLLKKGISFPGESLEEMAADSKKAMKQRIKKGINDYIDGAYKEL